MKNISTALQAHLEGELTTLAQLIKITRTDDVVAAFTTHDADIDYDGVCYKADGSYIQEPFYNDVGSKNVKSEISGIIGSDFIKDEDLRAGYYDHAQIDIYICNWADLSAGAVHLRHGWLGEVSLCGGKYNAEIRGFSDLLQRRVGDTYTPECRHDLGDENCRVDVSTVSGAVTALCDAAAFVDVNCGEENGVFDYGKLVWSSGLNAGLSMEVRSWNAESKTFSLWLPMPYEISVGDTYVVGRGCDKRFCTCAGKFDNALNFGGFPHLPGIGKILSYPDNR